MNKILLGEDAIIFLKRSADQDIRENSQKIYSFVKGGLYTYSYKTINHNEDKNVYVAFSCCGNETLIEEFDDVVEAAKYANGIMAKTINGELI